MIITIIILIIILFNLYNSNKKLSLSVKNCILLAEEHCFGCTLVCTEIKKVAIWAGTTSYTAVLAWKLSYFQIYNVTKAYITSV